MTSNVVTTSLADPVKLESLYHRDPATFVAQLYEALENHPHSQILKFWRARVEFQSKSFSKAGFTVSQLLQLLLLCLTASLAVRLPALLPVSEEWYYPRVLPLVIGSALIVYFALRDTLPLQITKAILGIVIVTTTTVLLLPDNLNSSSIVMALLHAPLVMWCALGLAFCAEDWRCNDNRLTFLRYNGELFIYTMLILAGGLVLSLLTMGLFELLNLSIEEWYMRNIGLAGFISAPIVATFLFDRVLGRNSRLATLIANVFTPLFLVMVVLYLLAMAIAQSSPYTDRNFLILFNGLLLLVLAMTIFSICGRNSDRPSMLADAVNLGLIGVTLIVNLVALSAIVYRLSEWGLSPNRVVVTGANLLIFTHLIWISFSYLKLLRGRAESEDLTRAVTRMLPAYGVWAAFVMVGIPLLFE
ncbi:MAG: hypothetical protein O2971_04135 [Proteobacteria bacterium]|nr:hypothetical protein [Pseudomonadota bacterium]